MIGIIGIIGVVATLAAWFFNKMTTDATPEDIPRPHLFKRNWSDGERIATAILIAASLIAHSHH